MPIKKLYVALVVFILFSAPQLSYAGTTSDILDAAGTVLGNPGTMLMGMFDNLLAGLFSIVAAISLSFAAAATFFTLIYADFLLAIGLFFGPFMLALSIMKRFRNAADKWIGFMLGAVATKVVAVLTVFCFLPIIEQIATLTGIQAGKTIGEGGAFAATSGMIATIMFSILMVMLVKESSGIATSLFGGFSGDSSLSGRDFAKAKITLPKKPTPPHPKKD